MTPEQLNTLLRDYSVRADGESEKCTGTHSYAWNKVVSAVLVDCADRVLEKKGLTEEEEERELFQNVRPLFPSTALTLFCGLVPL